MNLVEVYHNPKSRYKGDNYILVGSKIESTINPVYIDQFGNLYVPFGTLKFDYYGRYWYVGDMLIFDGGSSNPKAPPVSIGFTEIKYDEKGRPQYVGKMRIGYDYYERVSYLGGVMSVNYSGEGFTTRISTIGGYTYFDGFNASDKFYSQY